MATESQQGTRASLGGLANIPNTPNTPRFLAPKTTQDMGHNARKFLFDFYKLVASE